MASGEVNMYGIKTGHSDDESSKHGDNFGENGGNNIESPPPPSPSSLPKPTAKNIAVSSSSSGQRSSSSVKNLNITTDGFMFSSEIKKLTGELDLAHQQIGEYRDQLTKTDKHVEELQRKIDVLENNKQNCESVGVGAGAKAFFEKFASSIKTVIHEELSGFVIIPKRDFGEEPNGYSLRESGENELGSSMQLSSFVEEKNAETVSASTSKSLTVKTTPPPLRKRSLRSICNANDNQKHEDGPDEMKSILKSTDSHEATSTLCTRPGKRFLQSEAAKKASPAGLLNAALDGTIVPNKRKSTSGNILALQRRQRVASSVKTPIRFSKRVVAIKRSLSRRPDCICHPSRAKHQIAGNTRSFQVQQRKKMIRGKFQRRKSQVNPAVSVVPREATEKKGLYAKSKIASPFIMKISKNRKLSTVQRSVSPQPEAVPIFINGHGDDRDWEASTSRGESQYEKKVNHEGPDKNPVAAALTNYFESQEQQRKQQIVQKQKDNQTSDKTGMIGRRK